jgi:hypothetical protein
MKTRPFHVAAIALVVLLYGATWAFCIPGLRPDLKRAVIEMYVARAYEEVDHPFGALTQQQAVADELVRVHFEVSWAIPVAPGIVLTSYEISQGHAGLSEWGLVYWPGTACRVLWAWRTGTS